MKTDLIYGKRIPAEKMIASAREYRERFLTEAADMEKVRENSEQIYRNMEAINKLIDGVKTGYSRNALRVYNLNYQLEVY